METIDGYLQLGLIGILILAVRLLILPFNIYNFAWSFKGFWNTVKGSNYPSEMYKSVVFYFSAATMAFQLMAYHGMSMMYYSPIVSLVFQCFLAMGTIMATVVRRKTVNNKWEKFYWLMKGDNLDSAMRAASLNLVDPEYTRRRLDRAEQDLNSRVTKI